MQDFFGSVIDMNDKKVRRLVLAALFAALCTVMTMVVQIPTPTQGYLNLGDCAVLLAAWVLGPWYGGAAAGIGSMLADLLSYPLYAPATLAIKLAMGVAAGLLFRAMRTSGGRCLAAQLVSGVTAELIMTLGYFGYECLLLRQGLAAAVGIPGNLVQGAVGLVIATVVYSLLARSRVLTEV